MSVELKIKAMSLAAEASIIRIQERRLLKRIRKRKAADHPHVLKMRADRASLYWHRIGDVRIEARATCWARAIIAGKPKLLIENVTHELPEAQYIKLISAAGRMVLRYDPSMISPPRPGDNRTTLDRAVDCVRVWAAAEAPKDVREFVIARQALGRAMVMEKKKASKAMYTPTEITELRAASVYMRLIRPSQA